jgi:hypothetical protein
MLSRERFASASICSKSAIKASADSPCGDDSPQKTNVTVLIVKAFMNPIVSIVAYFVSANSIIEAADVGENLAQFRQLSTNTLSSKSSITGVSATSEI